MSCIRRFEVMYDFILILTAVSQTNRKKKLEKKFDILINSTKRNNSYILFDDSQQHVNLTYKSYNDNKQVNDPCFKNLSDTVIPNSVIDILRLGEKFRSPHNL